MNEAEARLAVEEAIAMALKGRPSLQMGFEDIRKENVALKETLEFQQSCTMDRYFKLKKAKKLLKFWVNDFYDAFNNSNKYEERRKAIVESEQLLKEIEE